MSAHQSGTRPSLLLERLIPHIVTFQSPSQPSRASPKPTPSPQLLTQTELISFSPALIHVSLTVELFMWVLIFLNRL